MDYSLEAENIEKFNTVSAQVGDGIRGPKVYKELSTTKVLTMEFIEGYSLSQIINFKKKGGEELQKLGFSGKEMINKLIRNVLETAHIYGFSMLILIQQTLSLHPIESWSILILE